MGTRKRDREGQREGEKDRRKLTDREKGRKQEDKA